MGREMGGRVKREGVYAYLWLIHIEISQKTTKFSKAIILQLIKLKEKEGSLRKVIPSLPSDNCFSRFHKGPGFLAVYIH